MTYNSNMRRSSLALGADASFQTGRKAGSLAWACMLVSTLVSLLALGIAVRGAVTSGDYRSILSHQTLTPFITIAYAVIGALIASRHWRNPIGWIFVTVALLYAVTALASAVATYGPAASRLYNWAVWLDSWVWMPAILLPTTFVLLVFPYGNLPSPRWRFVAWSTALGLALVTLQGMLQPGPLANIVSASSPAIFLANSKFLNVLANLGAAILSIGFFGSWAGFFLRFRRSAGIEREQMKWLAYTIGLVALSWVVTTLAWLFWPDSQLSDEFSIFLTNLTILGIAVAAAIAILRHRLYDIDLIINRTLVYTALTAGVAGLYGLVVGVLGALFQAQSNLLVSLLATGLAAILVQPMRDRLQRLVNHLMYGERDDPYAVLSGLSRQLEGLQSPEAALPMVVETVAQALKLPYVAVALKQDGRFETTASFGIGGDDLVRLPLTYQGETIGQLRLSLRSPQEAFTPGEQRLLGDIARHVGVTAHTVLLTRDLRQLAEALQRSREELVKSREEERRRLRRDLHDELGPQLASLKLNLDVSRNLVRRDPAAAEVLLVNLRGQSQAAIADIRRLVFDLRPPALDELGLVGAIQEYTRQIMSQDGAQNGGHSGLKIRLESPPDLPPLPAAVEVATYRITLEALANFVRHSQGSNCHISLSQPDQHFQVEICDDGLGIPAEIQPGVGLSSMRERAAELGGTCVIAARPQGGTRVLARLPLE